MNKKVTQVNLDHFSLIISIGLMLGFLLLFKNSAVFGWIAADYEPEYVEYSRNIFHPDHMARVMYWGESILLPILANIFGASKSKTSFFFFCSFISILLLPIFAGLTYKKLDSLPKSLLLIFILGLSFLHNGGGSPDSMIIMLMGIAALTSSLLVMFFAIALCVLAHFSIALLATFGLSAVLYFSPLLNDREQRKRALIGMSALVVGRLLLELWFWRFNYLQSYGRLKYVMDAGFDLFLKRYLDAPLSFWLAPTVPFLAVFLTIFLYFCYLKKYKFCISALFPLFLGYLAMFFTVDGHRIFQAVTSGAFIYLVYCFISSIPNPLSKQPVAEVVD